MKNLCGDNEFLARYKRLKLCFQRIRLNKSGGKRTMNLENGAIIRNCDSNNNNRKWLAKHSKKTF